MKNNQSLNISLIGSGGDGVMSSASMLLKTAAQMGLYGMMMQSYGPQIRGGEAAAHITLGTEPVRTVDKIKDLIVCFRFSDAVRFEKEIQPKKGCIILYGAEEKDIPKIFRDNSQQQIPIAFNEILEKNELPEIAKNILVFGIILKALEMDLEHGKKCVQDIFAHKTVATVSSNLRALEIGYHYLQKDDLGIEKLLIEQEMVRPVFTGNEASAHAAVAAGCRFYAGYPITPSSEILETMYELLPKVGGRLIQAEDEIAALGMVIGASFGGIPAMTATSGPGLSLMTELLGLSSMVEIPVVVVDCQRAGPATGLPSRTEQSDLWHAIYGGHGDFPRVVLAPTDVRDCYRTLFRAFHCAENFQLPVIVLSDANIAQRSEVIDPVDTSHFPVAKRLLPERIDENYKRFNLEALSDQNGINATALPGMSGGMHCIAGIEHTEKGSPSADGDLHEEMNLKRFKKMELLKETTADWFHIYGNLKATHALIAWGSSAGVAREWVLENPDYAVFIPEILHPFPQKGLKNFLAEKKSVVVWEMNFQGQLCHHLKAIGVLDEKAIQISRSGGLPFQTENLSRSFNQGEAL
ncbi:MAG: 2-oxoacid:acceptor oxidoreductase subunit alpha [Deltaproteobacteria bacterium]|nr:2-oxoacid:acceptor oxidoreductase subunit alpha [Deltaproteobacteria bacterium]